MKKLCRFAGRVRLRASHPLHARARESERQITPSEECMFCPECGFDAEEARFCPECGTDLDLFRAVVGEANVDDEVERAPRARVAHDRLARKDRGAQGAVTPAQAPTAIGAASADTLSAGSRREAQARLAGGHLDGLRRAGGGRRHYGVRRHPDAVELRRRLERRSDHRPDRGRYLGHLFRPCPARQRPLRPRRPGVPEEGSEHRRAVLRRGRQGLPRRLEAAGHGPQRGDRLRYFALLLRRTRTARSNR